MILFDALDGVVHTDEAAIKERLYFEYGEIWFDGRSETHGARKILTKTEQNSSNDIKANGEYKIEAVRIKDHALIRISGKTQTAEAIVALPDSTRFFYIGLTSKNCRITNISIDKAETESSADYIPRIAEKISYIDAPAGDMPNVQIDGFRSDAADGVEIRTGFKSHFIQKACPLQDLYGIARLLIYSVPMTER